MEQRPPPLLPQLRDRKTQQSDHENQNHHKVKQKVHFRKAKGKLHRADGVCQESVGVVQLGRLVGLDVVALDEVDIGEVEEVAAEGSEVSEVVPLREFVERVEDLVLSVVLDFEVVQDVHGEQSEHVELEPKAEMGHFATMLL